MRTWYFVVVLLLVPSVLAAECAYPTNICDSAHFNRVSGASGALYDYYNSRGTYLNGDDKFAAALFYYHNQDGRADQQLQDALGLGDLSAINAVYSYWAIKNYGAAMDAGLISSVQSKRIVVSGGADDFLREVAQYLQDGSKQAELTNRLTTAGTQGWGEMEYQPQELAYVVVGLQALYAAGDDLALRKLAEMNLDLLFTKFAAQSMNGVWVGPKSGQRMKEGAYYHQSLPWYGWNYILFGSGEIVVVEPSLVVSGYCAHQATRNIAQSVRVLKDDTQSHLFGAYVDPDSHAIGASLDVSSKAFAPAEGYVTKAYVQIGDDPYAFVELNTRVGGDFSDTTPTPERVAMMSNNVIIGDLGGDACKESHALFGKGFSFATKGNIVAFENAGVYGIIHFSSAPAVTNITARYPNKASNLPIVIAENGNVSYPTGAGTHFALEMIPESVVSSCDFSLQCVADKADANSQLLQQSGRVEYRSSLQGSNKVYTFRPDGVMSPQPTSYAPKHVVGSAGENLLSLNGRSWRLQQGSASINLDFSGADVDALKYVGSPTAVDANYNCQASSSGPTELVISNLGFVAASFRESIEGDYVIDCSSGRGALPNDKLSDVVAGSCVVKAPDMQSVALIYQGPLDDIENPPVKQALSEMGVYFPFSGGLGISFDTDLCTQAAQDTAENDNFVSCGLINTAASSLGLPGHDPLYVWVNGKHQALVVTNKLNPFSGSGWLSGVGDWLKSVFGTPLVAGATNVADFKAAYFSRTGQKEVSALLGHNNNGIVNATNFERSIAQLAVGRDAYKSGGQTQLVLFTDSTPPGANSKWSKLTRALRVQDMGGSANSFDSTCGGVQIDYIPECNSPNSVIGKCVIGDRSQDRLCNSVCRIDDGACENCVDLDGDGYYRAGCPDQEDVDCDDTRAEVNPGIEGDSCDALDNDCDNLVDEDGDCSAGGSGAIRSYSCAQLQNAGCSDVCYVAPPLSDVDVLVSVGHYMNSCPSGTVSLGQSYNHYGEVCKRRVFLCGTKQPLLSLNPTDQIITGLTYSLSTSVCPAGYTLATQTARQKESAEVTSKGSKNTVPTNSMVLCVQKMQLQNANSNQIIADARFADNNAQCSTWGYTQASQTSYSGRYCVDQIKLCTLSVAEKVILG